MSAPRPLRAPPCRFGLSVERHPDGRLDVAVTLPAVPSEAGGGPVDGWSYFSDLEAAVVQLLLDGGAMSGGEIARRLDESQGGRLKAALPALVDRSVLRITKDGYVVNAAPSQLPAVRALLPVPPPVLVPARPEAPRPPRHADELSDAELAGRIAAARAEKAARNGACH
jgi:hypothetical protein